MNLLMWASTKIDDKMSEGILLTLLKPYKTRSYVANCHLYNGRYVYANKSHRYKEYYQHSSDALQKREIKPGI